MNKVYVLNNLLDESLFLKDTNNDTRIVSESKKFANRRSAEGFIKRNKLTENYSVKLIPSRSIRLKESISDKELKSELESILDDTKDMIDTSLDYVQEMVKVNENNFEGSNIEDVLDRLKKLKKSASVISFRPSFYDSGVRDKNQQTTKEDDSEVAIGGESNETIN